MFRLVVDAPAAGLHIGNPLTREKKWQICCASSHVKKETEIPLQQQPSSSHFLLLLKGALEIKAKRMVGDDIKLDMREITRRRK